MIRRKKIGLFLVLISVLLIGGSFVESFSENASSTTFDNFSSISKNKTMYNNNDFSNQTNISSNNNTNLSKTNAEQKENLNLSTSSYLKNSQEIFEEEIFENKTNNRNLTISKREKELLFLKIGDGQLKQRNKPKIQRLNTFFQNQKTTNSTRGNVQMSTRSKPPKSAPTLNQNVEDKARIIITLRDTENKKEIKKILKEILPLNTDISSLNAISVNVTFEELELLSNNPYIKYIEKDDEVQATMTEVITLTNATSVWTYNEKSFQGENQTVCVIDTGINYNHPDFGSCTPNFGSDPNEADWTNCEKIIGGYDFVNDDNNPFDDHWHGTHCAGIISANGTIQGIAPKSQLYIIKALNSTGGGFLANVVKGINRCVEKANDYNISVISMSLGGGLFSTYCDDSFPSYTTAINNATQHNISVIIASGNEKESSLISAPACIQSAIPVSAINKSEAVSTFSNRNNLVKLFSFGEDIISTFLGSSYAVSSGTSMATPTVAGAYLLINQFAQSNNETFTPLEIESLLYNTGVNITDDANPTLDFRRYNLLSAFNYLNQTYCQENITNTSWNSPYANGSCQLNDSIQYLQNATQYDAQMCRVTLNTTIYQTYNYTTCDYCTPSINWTEFGDWYNITSCNASDLQNRQRNKTTYDINGCYATTSLASDNITVQIQYENETVACDFCTPNLVNTSWSEPNINGSCNVNNTIQYIQNATQYDANFCNEVSNTTVYRINRTEGCTYVVPPSFELDSIPLISNQSIDVNFTTNSSALCTFNFSGSFSTYSYQETSCNVSGCTPSWVLINEEIGNSNPIAIDLSYVTNHQFTFNMTNYYKYVINITCSNINNVTESRVTNSFTHRESDVIIDSFQSGKKNYRDDQEISFKTDITTLNTIINATLNISFAENITNIVHTKNITEIIGTNYSISNSTTFSSTNLSKGNYTATLFVKDKFNQTALKRYNFSVYEKIKHKINITESNNNYTVYYIDPDTDETIAKFTSSNETTQEADILNKTITLRIKSNEFYVEFSIDQGNFTSPLSFRKDSANISDSTLKIGNTSRFKPLSVMNFEVFNITQNKSFTLKWDYSSLNVSNPCDLVIRKSYYNWTSNQTNLGLGKTYSCEDFSNTLFVNENEEFIYINITSFSSFALLEDKATTEICDNSIDDDYDGAIDEGCNDAPISSSSGGGSNGGSAPGVAKILLSNISKNVTLANGVKAKLAYNNETFDFRAFNITEELLKLNFSNRIFTIFKNTFATFDVNQDGTKDLEITYYGLEYNRAKFEISLYEESKDSRTPQVKTNNQNSKNNKTSTNTIQNLNNSKTNATSTNESKTKGTSFLGIIALILIVTICSTAIIGVVFVFHKTGRLQKIEDKVISKVKSRTFLKNKNTNSIKSELEKIEAFAKNFEEEFKKLP